MRGIRIHSERLGTIAHYVGVLCEYLLVILLAVWLNIVLMLPSLSNLPCGASGFVLVALGLFLIAWCCWLQFEIGQGTTGFSEPTKNLVIEGPYGIVRNPLMHGQFLFFAGFGFLLDALAMFLVLPVVILMTHVFIVLVEEPDLRKRFGQEWIDYAETVPRWLPRHSSTRKDPAPMQTQDGKK